MLRVFIVDDELDARDSMISCINWEEHGMKVIASADNGLTALETIQTQWPDIVLIDVQMRGMTGLEVIERVRRSDCLQPVFIVISGYDDFENLQKAIRLKVDGYLLKPFRPQDVLDIIHRHMWDAGLEKGQPSLDERFGNALIDVLKNHTQKYQYPFEQERLVLTAMINGSEGDIDVAFASFAGSLEAQHLESEAQLNCYLILYAEMLRHAVRPIAQREVEDERWNSHDPVGSIRRLLLGIAHVIHDQNHDRGNRHMSPAARARKFIDANYAQHLTLSYVADQIGITATYLSSCLAAEYDMGFIDYIKNVRTEHAKELLAGGSMSVEDVASACGYPDAKYFRQVFRQLTGQSPAAYRDRMTRGQEK